MKVIISGGCGFIGHHMVEHFLKNTDWEIIVLDKLNYAANGFDRLRDIKAFVHDRVRVITCDFSQEISVGVKQEIGKHVDYFLHLAAETHVDNSIDNPWPFIQSNIIGTYHMLQFVRQLDSLKKVFYFSTDEVFGPAASEKARCSFDRHEIFEYRTDRNLYDAYQEWDRYNSGNPYSATKAGGEELCLAWHNTHKVPVVITHCMNAFGERQHPEKFIPKVVRSILKGEEVTIHADKNCEVPGSRFYIHCRNIASAILFLISKGAKIQAGDKFNIVGEMEVDNLRLAKMIEKSIHQVSDLPATTCSLRYDLVDFHSSRPGHDLRYALDGSKMKELGWSPGNTFATSLEKTVEWMIRKENLRWLNL